MAREHRKYIMNLNINLCEVQDFMNEVEDTGKWKAKRKSRLGGNVTIKKEKNKPGIYPTLIKIKCWLHSLWQQHEVVTHFVTINISQ